MPVESLDLPAEFQRRIRGAFGSAGAEWLARLPMLIKVVCTENGLTPLPYSHEQSYNYVAPVRRSDGSLAVLKAGVPRPELFHEIEALRYYAGAGAVRLLADWPERGAFLLEQVQPGTPAAELADDDQATRLAARVMQALHTPRLEPPGDFPTTAEWSLGFQRLRARYNGGCGPLPEALVSAAEGIFQDLLATSAPPVLLHGDLHHWNLLASQRRGWLAIDPQGVLGEPAYEVGAWLRNPYPALARWPDARRKQARRIGIFAEMLGFDEQRMWGWGCAQAVLAAAWSDEDGETNVEVWLAIARALQPGN